MILDITTIKKNFQLLINSLYVWSSRWLFSTNHKDIGTLYLIFGGIAGVIGTAIIILSCLELANPCNQIFQGNHQLYNVVITVHAFLIILFIVIPILIGGFSHGLVPQIIGKPIIKKFNEKNLYFTLNIDLFFVIRDLADYILDSEYRYIIYWCLYFLFPLVMVLPTFNSIRKTTYLGIWVIFFCMMGTTDLALIFAYYIKCFHYEIFSEHMSHFLCYIHDPKYKFDILFWENLTIIGFPLFLKILDSYHNKFVKSQFIFTRSIDQTTSRTWVYYELFRLLTEWVYNGLLWFFVLYEHKVFWLCLILLEILISNKVCSGEYFLLI